MANDTVKEITAKQAAHIEKYELARLHNFKLNLDELQIVFEGIGSEHKAKRFGKLLNSLR